MSKICIFYKNVLNFRHSVLTSSLRNLNFNMNFERFCFLIKNNSTKIRRTRLIKPLLQYFWQIRRINKQKLKLGKISYEFNYFNNDLNVFEEPIKMRYINQDTSHHLDTKLEQISKNLTKKWTKKQWVLAVLVLLIFIILLYFVFFHWYQTSFNSPAEKLFFSNILRLGLELIFPTQIQTSWNFNQHLFEMIFQLCQNFTFIA